MYPAPENLPEDKEELVELALAAFNEEKAKSLCQAAADHNAVRDTVRRRFNVIPPRKSAHASQQILSPAEENTLVSWCLQYHAWGYPPRIDILVDMAQAIRNRKFIDGDNSLPLSPIGQNWYKRFLGRHSELSLIYSRKLDHTRAMNNNPKIISEFFNLYKSVLSEYNITTGTTFNMDEKGFLLGLAKSSKVIVHSSKKYRFVTQDGNRETVTVLEAVSATGFVCPPMLIYKGTHHQKGWHEDSHLVPKNWQFAVSQKGWTNSQLALDWLERCFDIPTRHFLTSPSQYRLLLLDGHESHISWSFIEYCLSHKIVALCLPPHSTHLLQPLDVGLFSPYNHYYGREVDNMVRLGVTGIGKPLFLQMFIRAREKTFAQRTIKNAFVEAGLVPCSPIKVLRKLPNFSDRSTPPPALSNTSGPPVTPRKPEQLKAHISEILTDLNELGATTPTRVRVLQLGKAIEMGIAENSILLNTNTQLRNANRMRRSQDKRVLSKARVLSAEEAQLLKRKVEEKEITAAKKRKVSAAGSKKSGTSKQNLSYKQASETGPASRVEQASGNRLIDGSDSKRIGRADGQSGVDGDKPCGVKGGRESGTLHTAYDQAISMADAGERQWEFVNIFTTIP